MSKRYIALTIVLQDFFEFLEHERSRDFELLARKYRAIGPLLTKMEGLVVHTNTGKSPKLSQYYSYWEKFMYESLLKVNLLLYVDVRFQENVTLYLN